MLPIVLFLSLSSAIIGNNNQSPFASASVLTITDAFPEISNNEQPGPENTAVWPGVICPLQCRCSLQMSPRFQARLRTVDCSNLNLYALPTDLPADVQVIMAQNNRLRFFGTSSAIIGDQTLLRDLIHLDLSHNLIEWIDNEAAIAEGGVYSGMTIGDKEVEQQQQHLYNLKYLDLSFNRLAKLDDFQFDGLFNLEELNLADNLLFFIGDKAFGGLPKLETLRLSGNRLSFVQNAWWSNGNLHTLYNLHIDRNRLTFLQADSFKTLTNLVTLDLSKNKLFRADPEAFADSARLESLNLNSNFFVHVPRDALRPLKSIKSINMARNALFKIRTDDFADFRRLRDLTLSNMQRLRLVERGAFKNLPELLLVDLHDNPYLGYLDRSAFINSDGLTHLHLHNNNLTVLERETLDSLPSLEVVSFYGNPLLCDCNARWLNKFLTEPSEVVDNKSKQSHRTIAFSEADRLVCDGPAEHRFKLFTTLSPSDIPRECAPRILKMFDGANVRKVGDDITYDCRAVGMPKPRLTWVAPSGDIVVPGVYHPRRMLINGDTLVIRRMNVEDAGMYACIAENHAGNDVAQTALNVTSIQVELHVQKVTSRSVTITWSGPDRNANIFQLQYRPATNLMTAPENAHLAAENLSVTRPLMLRHRRFAATLTPIMKSYTIQNLIPGTSYEICISVEDERNVMIQIYCARFTTMGSNDIDAVRESDVVMGFQGAAATLDRPGNVFVGVVLSILAFLLIMLCFLALKFRNIIKRSCAYHYTFGSQHSTMRHQPLSARDFSSQGNFYTLCASTTTSTDDIASTTFNKDSNILCRSLININGKINTSQSNQSLNDSVIVYL